MCNANIPDDLLERQRRVRAGFVIRGTSLTAWCRSNGVKQQNAHKALRGEWQGPKATEVVEAILKASGVAE